MQTDAMHSSLAAAWSEAVVLFRLAERMGAFDAVLRDIAPSQDSDTGMKRYRKLVASFFTHFQRGGGVPKRRPNFPPPPRPIEPPRPRAPQGLPREKVLAIQAALRAGDSVMQVSSRLRAAPQTVRKIRRQLGLPASGHISAQKIRDIRQALARGESTHEIIKKLRTCFATICKIRSEQREQAHAA